MTEHIDMLPTQCFGVICTTPMVLGSDIDQMELFRLVQRHMRNDWGDLCDADRQLNIDAVNSIDGRVHSVYTTENGEKIWIISYLQSDPEKQRDVDYCHTTVMFPSEY